MFSCPQNSLPLCLSVSGSFHIQYLFLAFAHRDLSNFFQSSDDILYCRWCDIRHLCNFTFKNMFFKLFHNFYMQVLCTGSPICTSLLSEKLFLYPIITLLMFLHLFLFQLFFALFPTCWRHFAAIKFKVRQEFSWNTKMCQYEHWILWISRTAVVTLSCTQLWDFNPKQPESFSFVTLTESRSRRLLETFVYSNTDIYLTCTFSPCCSM